MQVVETPPRRNSEASLIPLINVVFLLLVFFLIAGSIRPGQSNRITLPESSQHQTQVTPHAVIELHADGRVQINGASLDRSSLMRVMSELPVPPGQALIRVRADRNLPVAAILEILGLLREAGVPSFELETRA